MTIARVLQDTSLSAYIDLLPEVGERQYLVYCAFRDYGVPATDREITLSLGKSDPNYVRPRRKELYDLGLIRMEGKRVCTVTGKMVCTWKVVIRQGENNA